MQMSTNQNKYSFQIFGKAIGIIFMLVISVTMTITGIVALSEGTGRFVLPFTTDDATETMKKNLVIVKDQPTLENIKPFGLEIWGLSKMTEASRFSESRLLEHGIYFTTMPKYNQILMLIHILFGSFCMLFGSLQFWPTFRKKYMKAHRVIGVIYIITVPISVVTSLMYLANTAPHYIYDHLVAWIALWLFGFFALLSIFMAVRSLSKKRIFEHQAWMAASFACLMVAPMLRWDWALLAQIFPKIDQETLNLVTMGIMLPETILIGYGLILINRQYQRPMKQRKLHTFAEKSFKVFQQILPVLYFLATLIIATNIYYFVLKEGLASFSYAEKLLPKLLIQKEQEILNSSTLLTGLFAICLGLALILGLYLFSNLLKIKNPDELSSKKIRLSQILVISVLVAGSISIYFGLNIGLQTHNAIFSGGTMYSVCGALIFIFGVALSAATRLKNLAYMKEMLVFLLCLLPFTALFLLTLYVLSFLPIPTDYINVGQGFVIPVGFSTGLLFLAFTYVIFGQATREHN